MRKQTRPPEPEVFAENAEKWNAQWAELRRKQPGAQFKWYKLGKRPAREWALPPLREMNQSHCSFCDTFPIADRAIESIEHFKPKSREEFYGEAYTWTNLYFCCNFCQMFKAEQWDENLLRPDDPDYEFLRYFEFDYTTGAIRPSLTASPERQKRADITIQLYGLDRPEKQRERRRELGKFRSDCDLDEFAYRDYLEGKPL
jgi:uncharacterized protein (TIGR02646 family)